VHLRVSRDGGFTMRSSAHGAGGGTPWHCPLWFLNKGELAADSWELTIEEIHRLAPELTLLALDMPGPRNKPGDLWEMTIADYVDSLVGVSRCD
jgi:hypothetical protein